MGGEGGAACQLLEESCAQRIGHVGAAPQPTTTMRILIFRGFDWNPAEGADAAKWLKST
jgi:hypothetical protein